MYISRIKRQHNNKTYVTTLIRESYRQNGKVLHRTVANLSRLPAEVISSIERYFANPAAQLCDAPQLKIMRSREYGASRAFMDLAIELGLDKTIFSRKEPWRQDALAMILGRLIHQGSKLHLCNLHQDSYVWAVTGYGETHDPEVDKHCYQVLDKLLSRQQAIQKTLAKQHLHNGSLVMYDITSSYLEGEYAESQLVDFGYSRDNKRKHEQVVIGLLTAANGCPIAIEVFRGNTSDQTTVLKKAQELANIYQVKHVVFVADRGMLTPKRIDEVNHLGYQTLTAMTHVKLRELCKDGTFDPAQFQVDEVVEVAGESDSGVRYFLCKNPVKELENRNTRRELIKCTTEAMDQIGSSRRGTEHQKSAQIGKVLAKYKVGKFFQWSFVDGKLVFTLEQDKIRAEEQLDGCYVIMTDSDLSKEQAVSSYKGLSRIERAFRNMKTMSLEIRPIYHRTDERIRAHVFLCMLAYYLEWHARQRLLPLFATNQPGASRRFSFSIAMARLQSIRIQDCYVGDTLMPGIISTPDNEQQKILDLIGGSQNREI